MDFSSHGLCFIIPCKAVWGSMTGYGSITVSRLQLRSTISTLPSSLNFLPTSQTCRQSSRASYSRKPHKSSRCRLLTKTDHPCSTFSFEHIYWLSPWSASAVLTRIFAKLCARCEQFMANQISHNCLPQYKTPNPVRRLHRSSSEQFQA